MMSHFSITSGFLIIISLVYVDSVCVQGQVTNQVTKHGTTDTQCVLDNIKVLPGSTFKLPAPQCLECKCTAKSMTCCGFGFAAGTVGAPPGCIAHNDACKLIFVKANNQSEPCTPSKSTGSNNQKKKPVKSNKP